jgi:hypothetical protein
MFDSLRNVPNTCSERKPTIIDKPLQIFGAAASHINHKEEDKTTIITNGDRNLII